MYGVPDSFEVAFLEESEEDVLDRSKKLLAIKVISNETNETRRSASTGCRCLRTLVMADSSCDAIASLPRPPGVMLYLPCPPQAAPSVPRLACCKFVVKRSTIEKIHKLSRELSESPATSSTEGWGTLATTRRQTTSDFSRIFSSNPGSVRL